MCLTTITVTKKITKPKIVYKAVIKKENLYSSKIRRDSTYALNELVRDTANIKIPLQDSHGTEIGGAYNTGFHFVTKIGDALKFMFDLGYCIDNLTILKCVIPKGCETIFGTQDVHNYGVGEVYTYKAVVAKEFTPIAEVKPHVLEKARRDASNKNR